MNIGSLYKVKQYFWLLFSTKAVGVKEQLRRPATVMTIFAAESADYWSRQLKCEVTYFSPDSIIVFLEEDGKYKKVLTSDGMIGWIWFSDHYNDCFEEVKTEQ